MSVVSHTITGFPRPVGSEYRQRQVYAPESYGSKQRVPWVVSVVDTPQGPMVEARKAISDSAIVAIDLLHFGTSGDDVLAQVKPLLSTDEGWTTHTVRECGVNGCTNPQPMWHSGWRNGGDECLTCSMRTVLACVHCGAPDVARFIPQVRERMLADSVCHTCNCWLSLERDYEGSPLRVVTDDYVHYVIRHGVGSAGSKGFGGRKWVVTFTDGRVVETDDLWHQGVVPEWMRDRFTPNGSVVAAQSKVRHGV